MLVEKRRKCFFGFPICFTLYSIIEETDTCYFLIEKGIFKQNKTKVNMLKFNDISVKRSFFDLLEGVGTILNNSPRIEIGKIRRCKQFVKTIEFYSAKTKKEVGIVHSETILV